MWLKRQVVMLPTQDEKAPILSYLDNKNLQYFPKDYWSNDNLTKRHLYILSDEEIKVGDFVLNMYNGTSIFKITKVFSDGYEGQKIDDEFVYYGLNKTLKKIIATTDKS